LKQLFYMYFPVMNNSGQSEPSTVIQSSPHSLQTPHHKANYMKLQLQSKKHYCASALHLTLKC